MNSLQLTVPVLSLIVFLGSAAAYVALVVTGNGDQAEVFKLTMTVAVGAGLGVAVPSPKIP